MIRILSITNDDQLKTDLLINNLDLTQYKLTWIDFSEPTDQEVNHLLDTFHFHPLAIEDCVHSLQRPKLDYYEDFTFFVTHMVREENKEIKKEEVNYFIGSNYIVTYHSHSSNEVDQVWNKLLASKDLKHWEIYYVFYQVLDKIVDSYFPLIYKLEDELDKIETNNQNKSMEQLMTELFDTRYLLLDFRHVVNPMRDLLYRMLNSQHLVGVQQKKEYFSDIYDHLIKLSEMIMSDREITADIRDSYLSLNAHQTNNVMKILTIVTSIFVPLTFITGVFGMNFHNMPILSVKSGFNGTLFVMAVIALFMIYWSKRKGWF